MDDNQGQQPVLPNPDNVPRQLPRQNEGAARGGPPEYRAQHFQVEPNNPPPGFQPAQFPPRDNQGGQPPQPQPYIAHQYPHVRYMPSRYDRNAPKFDGKPTSLRRFFEEIEALARDCGINQREQITHTIRYLEGDDYDTWRSQPSARGDDWARFKQEITTLYPGAEDNARFNVTDLELFVERHAANPMKDRFQFGEYYRNFLTRAGWLLDRDIISHRERNKLFMNGFHIDFRHQLRTQLRLQDPVHPLDEPWDIADVEQAARFLLEGSSTSSILTLSAPSPAAAPSSSPPPRQTFDMSSIEQILTSDAFFNHLANRFNIPIQNNAQSPYHQFQQNGQQQQRRTNWPCGFCSDTDHIFKQCYRLDDYIRRGMCVRDTTNRICVPDGSQVSPQTAPGRNMMERIDNWHKSRSSQGVRAQANILGIAPTHANKPAGTAPSSMPYVTSLASQDEEELTRLEAIALANLKRQEEIRKRITNSEKARTIPSGSKQSTQTTNAPAKTPKAQPANPTNSSASSSPSHQQQFRFASPIEDPKAIQEVIQRSLDGTVTLTQRELYAIAPDVRKHIKEQVTTHRVPTGSSAAISALEEAGYDNESIPSSVLHQQSSRPSNSIIVANHIEDLRTIPLELDGKLTVDAILDEGSQIIGVRRDIWEKLGVPLLKDQGILMESANATTEMTLGLLRDLPVRIGSSIFYLQVQVFENAPYEMLLGRPFLTLTQAQTHHYRNGDSHITLIDPNTKETLTIPTMVRVRGPTQSNSGF